MSKPFDLSDTYWNGLTDRARELYGIIRPLPKAAYTVDHQLGYIEKFIVQQTEDLATMGGSFELDPDYQRGHVWSHEQRVGYIEALLRDSAPKTILFNCPGWSRSDGNEGDIPNHTFQCIDGLQRLTAVRKFMAGEVEVFGGLKAADLDKTPFDPKRYRLQFAVYEFVNREDLLQFYLDLNGGGTVHSQAELERVRGLRDEARNAKAEAAEPVRKAKTAKKGM